MRFDHDFLAALTPHDPRGWCDHLHDALATETEEIVGALLLHEGWPVAITSAALVDLHVCDASPGSLLGRALWLQADGLALFHTQVTASEPAIEERDLAFAQRCRDLVQLFGGVEIVDHWVFHSGPAPLLLGDDSRLTDPVELAKMERWTRREPVRRRPKFRHPVSGQTWTGVGKRPTWLRESLAMGFVMEDFALPHMPDLDEPGGVPSGAGLFRTVGRAAGPSEFAPRPPFRELAYADGFQVEPEAAHLARALRGLDVGPGPEVGIVLVADDDGVTGPRAGIVAPEAEVAARPEQLFRSALLDGAAWAMTFSRLPAGTEPFSAERRALIRRLVFLGELLGVRVRDHLVMQDDGGWTSLKSTTRWRWPVVPPLAEPAWPPFRRTHQTSRAVRHPGDGRIWNGRGPEPEWLRRLLDAGWDVDELKVYSG